MISQMLFITFFFSFLNYFFLNLAYLTFVSDLQQTNILCAVFLLVIICILQYNTM